MKNFLLSAAVFLFAVSAAFAQNQPATPLPQMDAAVKTLAGNINRRLITERSPKISVGQFSFRNLIPSLGSYWTNQLNEELAAVPNKTFTVLLEGTGGAEWTISGEIVEIAATIRVYTRLFRVSDRSVAASFHSDFERSPYLADMLSGGGRSSGAARDAREPDSWDYPVPVETGADENAPVMERSIHDGDEDFFLILPGENGRLVVETTGSSDTILELYDADTREKLDENDDGASGSNARIRRGVRAGKRYMVKVKGYGDETGQYGFRAYLSAGAAVIPDEYENDNESSGAKLLNIGTPQRHSFHDGDDVDWVKFQVNRGGRYTIRARGVSSTQLDTCIELFDANLNSIEENDDGGENYDSRLSLRLENGLYYLKAWCLDDEPEEPYTVSVEAD